MSPRPREGVYRRRRVIIITVSRRLRWKSHYPLVSERQSKPTAERPLLPAAAANKSPKPYRMTENLRDKTSSVIVFRVPACCGSLCGKSISRFVLPFIRVVRAAARAFSPSTVCRRNGVEKNKFYYLGVYVLYIGIRLLYICFWCVINARETAASSRRSGALRFTLLTRAVTTWMIHVTRLPGGENGIFFPSSDRRTPLPDVSRRRWFLHVLRTRVSLLV